MKNNLKRLQTSSKLLVLTIAIGLLSPLVSFAGLPTGLVDTAEILGANKMRAQAETQYSLNDQVSGLNFRGRLSSNIQEDSDLQGEFSIGSGSYLMAAFWKWAPFPDTSNQPAVGSRMGFFYGKKDGTSLYGFQAAPTVSKKISVGHLGQLIPYAGLPLALENSADSTTFVVKGTVGLQYTHPKTNLFHFLVEYGQPILNSDYHVSLALSYDL